MHRSCARTLVVEAEPHQTTHVFNPLKADEGFDWYGNSRLAALVGRDDGSSPSVVHQVVYLIEQFPAALATRNQFKRLPIHYALDKLSRKVNLEVVRLLLLSCPESASVRDFEGLSSLDLCGKWEHSAAVVKLVLEAQPAVFHKELLIFRHPNFYRVMAAFLRLFRSRKPEDEYNTTTLGEEEEEEESQDLVVAAESSDSPRSESSTLVHEDQEYFTSSSFVRRNSDSTTLVTVDGLLRQDSTNSLD